MPLDEPTFPGEAEISLQAATLTSSGCTNAALAVDDDPATAAVFGAPPLTDIAIPYSGAGPIPGNYWFSPADCEAANSGQHVTFAHGGGPLGVWLSDGYTPQNPSGAYGDNVQGNPDPVYALSLDASPNTVLAEVTPDIFSASVSYFGGGQSYPAGTYRVSYVTGTMKFQPNINGWTTGNIFVRAVSVAPRFLRVDWGFDAFISRIRLAYNGPGAGSVGVDYESSLSVDAGHTPALDIALSSLPVPVDGQVHEVLFSPPVLGRGAVFYPDALLPEPSSQVVNLSMLQVFEDVSQGVLPMSVTANQARVGCSGIQIFQRVPSVPTSYPFPAAGAATLRSISGLNYTKTFKVARETGGETVHQLNAYETDRETKCKVTVSRWDYQALVNFQGGVLIDVPANGNGPEQQYATENYTDRVPYFSVVAQSVNGDPSALVVMPKCKIDGSLTEDWERDKTTEFQVDFVCFWDANYTRQDGTVGGIVEKIFTNGGSTTLHS